MSDLWLDIFVAFAATFSSAGLGYVFGRRYNQRHPETVETQDPASDVEFVGRAVLGLTHDGAEEIRLVRDDYDGSWVATGLARNPMKNDD